MPEVNVLQWKYTNVLFFFPSYLGEIFIKLDEMGVAIVSSAGNDAAKGKTASDTLPQHLMNNGFDNLMVVGATDMNGRRASFSEVFKNGEPLLYAPGANVVVPDIDNGAWEFDDGTSLSAPMVGGLVAYLRGLRGVVEPAQVKATLHQLSRELNINSPEVIYDAAHPEGQRVAFAWNGQVKDKSCFLDGTLTDATGKFLCPESFRDCSSSSSSSGDERRDGTCPLPTSGPGGSSAGGTATGTPITWS